MTYYTHHRETDAQENVHSENSGKKKEKEKKNIRLNTVSQHHVVLHFQLYSYLSAQLFYTDTQYVKSPIAHLSLPAIIRYAHSLLALPLTPYIGQCLQGYCLCCQFDILGGTPWSQQ